MSSSNGSGDTPSLTELYEKLRKAVTAVCPPWLQDRRDDLVQAAMMRVMDLQERSEGKRELSSSYLWKVAHSAVIDEIRRQRRRQEVAIEEVTPGDMPVPSSSSPEERARSREIDDGIQSCLEQMVPNRREAVTLKLQGHSVPDSADILGWTVKKTENLVYRGLRDLQDCLISKGLKP
jgi:RNA polymerase sigma-70 factor, ECF subfamily